MNVAFQKPSIKILLADSQSTQQKVSPLSLHSKDFEKSKEPPSLTAEQSLRFAANKSTKSEDLNV